MKKVNNNKCIGKYPSTINNAIRQTIVYRQYFSIKTIRPLSNIQLVLLKGTVMQIEKTLKNYRLSVSKVS